MKPEKRWITALQNPGKIFCFLSRIPCWQAHLLQQHMLEKCSETGLGYTDLQTGWWESGLQQDSLVNQWLNLALHNLLSHEASAIFAGVEHGLATWEWCVWSWDGWSKVFGKDFGETGVAKRGLQWPGLSVMEKTNSRWPDLQRQLNRETFPQHFPWENEGTPCGLASSCSGSSAHLPPLAGSGCCPEPTTCLPGCTSRHYPVCSH